MAVYALLFCVFIFLHPSMVKSATALSPVVIETDVMGACPPQQEIDSAIKNVRESIKEFLNVGIHCGPGEWRRVAYLNMSDPTQQCPSAWREYNTGGVRACGRPLSTVASCAEVQYPSNNSQYSRVCGRAIGYQFGATDAFGNAALERTIDSYYVYGVSFTHGSPRTHIWTLAAGVTEGSISHAKFNCPCAYHSTQVPPSFVGDAYYCESGNPTDTYITHHLYSEDPLWDGGQCEGECCSNGKSPPWFSVELTNPTTDDIDVRICCPQPTYDDVPIQLLEVYVQ